MPNTGIDLVFEKERETKGTWRFAEWGVPEDERPIVGSLYVTKTQLAEIGDPTRIRVHIEAG